MRRVSRGAVHASVLLLAALSAACAANTAADSEPVTETAVVGGASVFVVQNNQADGRDIVVYLEPEGRGERRTLGTVGVGRTGTFNHDAARGYYTLIAAHNFGESKSSRFNVPGPSRVTWVLSTDRVTVDPR
jgi:hypothetical protein